MDKKPNSSSLKELYPDYNSFISQKIAVNKKPSSASQADLHC
jgi:hypothetical protein